MGKSLYVCPKCGSDDTICFAKMEVYLNDDNTFDSSSSDYPDELEFNCFNCGHTWEACLPPESTDKKYVLRDTEQPAMNFTMFNGEAEEE